MGYAINTDFMSGSGALNPTWWNVKSTYLTASCQRNGGIVGTPNAGTSWVYYQYSGMSQDQKLTATGLTGLNNGILLFMLRSKFFAGNYNEGYFGQLFYNAGSVQYRCVKSTSAGVETELFNTTTGTYSDSTTTKYTFMCVGSTIKFQLNGSDVTGASATDSTYANTSCGFGMYTGSASYAIYNNNWTVDGAYASVGNMLVYG